MTPGATPVAPPAVDPAFSAFLDRTEEWAVARELRIRIKEAFDEEGIEMPFPQRTVWVKQEK